MSAACPGPGFRRKAVPPELAFPFSSPCLAIPPAVEFCVTTRGARCARPAAWGMHMSTRVRWLGHPPIGIETGGHQLLIAPFFPGNPAAAITADEATADFLLVSHGHGDHVGDTIAIA